MNETAWIQSYLVDLGLSEDMALGLAMMATMFTLLLIGVVSFFIARRLLLNGIKKWVIRSRTRWDDVLLEKKFFSRLAHIFPAIIIQKSAPYLFPAQDQLEQLLLRGTNIYLVVMVVLALFSLLQTIEYFLSQMSSLRDQPIGSYFQLGRILVALVGGVLVLSITLNKSPAFFLSAFGAMTAIVLLVFRDTILGFVASIQIAANNMVHIGDWVEMPKYGADGNVIQITLVTIKIRNFDKTISHIPTYAFISQSFKNWQGMSRSGGRRIKRAIHIKQSSIRFLKQDDIQRYQKYELVNDYLITKSREIEQVNATEGTDKSALINGRNLTNIGLFRFYAETFLRNSELIHQDPSMILMVRQLQPGPTGLPIEIYCFSRDTRWVSYEGIQSDIFDHLLAAIRYFDLEVFEYPSSTATSHFFPSEE